MKNARAWAESQFGNAELGDKRRTLRLVRMATRAAKAPGGRITGVFETPAERQAAYDFLEHESVRAAAVAEALFASTARASVGESKVFISTDGSSLSLTDHTNAKGFGSIGPAFPRNCNGLKVMNALALTANGTPIGVAEQIYWTRQARANHTTYRPVDARESVHWRNAVERIGGRYAEYAPQTMLHFLADREADAALFIKLLLRSRHEFTIRSNATRKAVIGSRLCAIHPLMRRRRPIAVMTVDLPATARREARRAVLDVRACRLPIRLRDRSTGDGPILRLTVVWARERRPPRGEERLDWTLYTNTNVLNAADACEVVRRYTYRWRIEDFHRTWKRGLCRVEDTQLRSPSAVIKWATILAAVASRAEHLRYRARSEPSAPATEEFSADELEAIDLLERQRRSKVRANAKDELLGEIVVRVALLGGYVRSKGNGPPGASTIGRGLERVLMAAEILTDLRAAGKLR